MITLYQFACAYEQPFSVSPFCAKTEAYLRLAGLDYTTRDADPRRAPLGKAPYIAAPGIDGLLADSQAIIEWCKATHGDVLDADLTDAQHAHGHAVRILVENRTYFLLLHTRWVTPEGWRDQHQVLRHMVPPIAKSFLPTVLRRGVRRQLHEQGVGRHSQAERDAMAVADVTALAHLLRDDFVVGPSVTSYDCALYGQLAGALATYVDNALKTAVSSSPTLMAWLRRMDEKLGWERR